MKLSLPELMPHKLLTVSCLFMLFGSFGFSSLNAQDTNAPAGTNAPAIASASIEPKPDPSGTATGASADAQDAGGTHFVVTEPTALNDEDKKDPAKVKKYQEDKKAFDEYTAQA